MIKDRNIYKSLLLIAALLPALLSCVKESHSCVNCHQEIAFQVFADNEMYVPEVRSEITQDNISSVTLFAKANNTNIFAPNASISINKPQTGVIWKPNTKYYWNNDVNYIFHGYAHSPIPSGGSLTVNSEGRGVTITQPATLSFDKGGQANTIDYLLSYQVNYEPSNTHQPVPIMLEHALTKVSLYVSRATSMNSLEISNVQVKFSKIKNQATLFCNKQKDYHKDYETNNEWSYNLGTSVADYSKIYGNADVKDEKNTTGPLMSFIAIPNDHEGMRDYQLSLSYDVTIHGTGGAQDTKHSYSRTFSLYDVSTMWQSGHHVIYKFLIDNGIHLTGSIVDWIDVDYIEGTVLPPIIVDNK